MRSVTRIAYVIAYIATLSHAFLFSSGLAHPEKTLAEIHRRIASGSHSRQREQERLLGLLKDRKRTLITNYGATVVECFSYGSAFPAIKSHKKELQEATAKLAHVDGFHSTLSKFIKTSHRPQGKGSLYEITKTLALVQRGEINVSMGPYMPVFEHRSYIDVTTEKRWIECKNINWAISDIDKLKGQFLKHLKALELYNYKNKTTLVYEVHSKTAIPIHIKQWLTDNGIGFHDEAHEEYVPGEIPRFLEPERPAPVMHRHEEASVSPAPLAVIAEEGHIEPEPPVPVVRLSRRARFVRVLRCIFQGRFRCRSCCVPT